MSKIFDLFTDTEVVIRSFRIRKLTFVIFCSTDEFSTLTGVVFNVVFHTIGSAYSRELL